MTTRLENFIAALAAAADDKSVYSEQAWNEFIDPYATTPFDSITAAERVVYVAAITINECLLDGDVETLAQFVEAAELV